MSGEPPRVAVVVLTWNGVRWLDGCLGSLRACTYPALRVYVVDNASIDATAAAVRVAYPGLTLLVNRHNLGFAGGCNVGIRRALADGADHVVVLNQDTRVDPGWLEPMVAAATADPGLGALSPLQLDYDGTGLDPIFDRYNLQRARPLAATGLFEVEWVVGAAVMLPRATCERVGLFDDNYFFYYEDLDLCRRVRRHGLRVVIVAAGRVFHHHSQVHSTMRSYYTSQYVLSRLIYFWKDPDRGVLDKLRGHRTWWSSKPRGWPDDWRHRWLALAVHARLLVRLPAILRRVAVERRSDAVSPRADTARRGRAGRPASR
jgi:GT2 family glycosyltransferase